MKSWDPFGDLLMIQDRMNKLFESLLSGPVSAEFDEQALSYWRPDAEVRETEAGLEIDCELDGMQLGDIEIHAKDNVLVIAGRRDREEQESGWTFHQVERPRGPFMRKFELPESIDLSKRRAWIEDGLLKIRLARSGALAASASSAPASEAAPAGSSSDH